MKCMRVDSDHGTYSIPLRRHVEIWETVLRECQEAGSQVRRIETLTGWGEWTSAYSVGGVVYFVAERGGDQ